MSKRTQEQADRAANQRLLRTYGISLCEYNDRLEAQGGVCKICRKPPAKLRLSVDHDHGWKKVKILTSKEHGVWTAVATYGPRQFHFGAAKKSDAVHTVKRMLLRASCRGILCVWCNRGLRFYHDDPAFMEAAAKYLRNHREGASVTQF